VGVAEAVATEEVGVAETVAVTVGLGKRILVGVGVRVWASVGEALNVRFRIYSMKAKDRKNVVLGDIGSFFVLEHIWR